MKVVIESYSTFYDVPTGTQFNPVLIPRTGLRVGVAEVPRKAAGQFKDRPSFQVLDDAAFLAYSALPEEPEDEAPSSGDPLQDAANQGAAASGASSSGAGTDPEQPGPDAPPAPPESK